MQRNLSLLTLLVLGLAPAGFAWAQDDSEQDTEETAQEEEPAPDSGDSAGLDAELDDELESENYADAEEEDFVPTEDIPTDQSIPFPTDI